VDAFVRRTIAADVILIAAGTALTALAAQVVVPLWPVPVTGQTFAALLVGSALGPVRGTASLLLYLLVGALGLPVFSDGSHGLGALVGTTGGYLVGLVLGTALTGWMAARKWDRRLLGAIVTYAAGVGVIFVPGLIWLAATTGAGIAQTLAWGLYPFILGEVVKILLAAAVIRCAWRANWAFRSPRP
tara:strand:- start:12731 stop:13291 length:561 start_codon:yes stop_codon:yes gene_type:complete